MKKRHDHVMKESEKNHVDTHVDVYKKYYTEQLNIKLRYIQPLHDASAKAVERVHETMKKRLDKLHDKQKGQVLSLMHSKRKSKLKDLQRRHKNKGEMDRLKREFESKHVRMSVNLCEWLSETVVPVSRQAIDDNIRTTLEQLQQQVADNQEKYKQACVDQITEKEKEIVKAISIMSITENGHSNKGSSEAEQAVENTTCSHPNSAISHNVSAPAKFEPITEEELEDDNTHL